MPLLGIHILVQRLEKYGYRKFPGNGEWVDFFISRRRYLFRQRITQRIDLRNECYGNKYDFREVFSS